MVRRHPVHRRWTKTYKKVPRGTNIIFQGSSDLRRSLLTSETVLAGRRNLLLTSETVDPRGLSYGGEGPAEAGDDAGCAPDVVV